LVGYAVPVANRAGHQHGAAGDRRALQVGASRAVRRPRPPERAALPALADAISLGLNLNAEGDSFDLEQVTLDTEFPTQDLPPYGLLLKEILEGDPPLFIRGDEAEGRWRIVGPVLSAWADNEVPIEEYPSGSSGPFAAPAAPPTTAAAQGGTAAATTPLGLIRSTKRFVVDAVGGWCRGRRGRW
jgi:Glucose-6-phosphate dehydrogenase, C-terminal domain